MKALDFLDAAKVPARIPPQEFGPWLLMRRTPAQARNWDFDGRGPTAVLNRTTGRTLHSGGDIVMEDSDRELKKHLPIWIAARGHVLVSGLGLGCVVRGLLAKPEVERVTVVEIDQKIIDVFWPEFRAEPRAMVLHGDALTYEWPPGMKFDFAWHDVWTEDESPPLQLLHSQLIARYRDMVPRQGAWAFPRWAKRFEGCIG